ncbi:peroxisome assembly protein (Peroxin-2) [Actinomortierella wolfii]|nr:peroxisome assembly protein (Peroxin-2) [Actinomortierella wolfii]
MSTSPPPSPPPLHNSVRLPSTVPAPFWEPDWKRIQAPLSALRRQLASFPSPPLRIMKPTFKEKFKPELTLLLNLIMYKFSVYDMGATYGSQLQNLVYRNERKHKGGLQSTAIDAPLTKNQKIAYGIVTVGGNYLSERLNRIITEQGWGELPDDNIKKKAWIVLQKAGSAFRILSLLNFLAFLYAGKYRSIVERILSMRLVYAQRASNRQASFEFLNRQMVWHAFTEFLMFLMPLINVSKLKRNVKNMLLPAAFQSANDLAMLPKHICAICHENNNATATTTSAAGGGGAAVMSTVIHNPYITSCGHVYCYYCIKTKMMIDDEWCCLRCGKKVEAIARLIETGAAEDEVEEENGLEEGEEEEHPEQELEGEGAIEESQSAIKNITE